ncbi:GPCR, PTH-type, partial [Lindgomyces ingoldianus]
AANMNASFVSTSLLGIAISLPILATISVILRIFARRAKGNGTFRADDWTILGTLLLCWGHSINTIVTGAIGGIDTITMAPREYANIALRTLWISGFFLITALYTVKISILLFYYHLFSINERFRQSILIMIATISAWWFSSLVCQILATDPIDASWKNAARAKHRFNFNAWYISYSGLSIFFDIVVLCFPIPMIKSLHINTKKKISILGIFWLGGFVCVSAIVRFVFLYNSIYRLTSLGQNQYSSITTAFIWAEVEPNASVIAACLPTYGPLF